MEYCCIECKSPLIVINDDNQDDLELLHCPECISYVNSEALKHPNQQDSLNENADAILDDQAIQRFKNVFESHPCPYCRSDDKLKKVEEMVIYCSKCDHLFGFDDGSDFAEITNFVPGFSQEEVIKELKVGDYVLEFECSVCKNSDPNLVEIRKDFKNTDCGLYCRVCKSPMNNAYDEINNLPDQCECDSDPSIIQFQYDRDGNIARAECPRCMRHIDVESTEDEGHQVEEKVKWYNRGSYSGRVKIDSLDLLEPGSHIAWHRTFSYWHHAIVTGVCKEKSTINVIHYSIQNSKGKIIREEIKVDFKSSNQMYRIDYQKARYSNEEAIKRAESRLGETRYNVFTNNCEHFAFFCKMGESYSQQVSDLLEYIKCRGAIFAAKAGVIAAKGTSLFAKNASFLAKYALKSLPFVNIGTAVTSIAYEAYDCYKVVKNALNDKKEGRIDNKECMKVIAKKIIRGVLVGLVTIIFSSIKLTTAVASFASVGAHLAADCVGSIIGRAVTTAKPLN